MLSEEYPMTVYFALDPARARSDATGRSRGRPASLLRMATAPPSEPLSQRLAAIREQMSLLADYL